MTYFLQPLGSEELGSIAGSSGDGGAELIEIEEIMPQDWLREYRRRSAPFAVGERWWVDPGEPDGRRAVPPDRRQLLRIPARTAFGTGSHASTSLIVELMDRLPLEGSRVLDVGTGSGILAMVALASGARSATALDVDPVAVFIARQTCGLNGFRPRLVAGGLASISSRGPKSTFDLIVANVLPANLRADLAAVVGHLRPRGNLLLSGLLLDQAEPAVATLRDLGLDSVRRRASGEWVAIQLEPRAP